MGLTVLLRKKQWCNSGQCANQRVTTQVSLEYSNVHLRMAPIVSVVAKYGCLHATCLVFSFFQIAFLFRCIWLHLIKKPLQAVLLMRLQETKGKLMKNYSACLQLGLFSCPQLIFVISNEGDILLWMEILNSSSVGKPWMISKLIWIDSWKMFPTINTDKCMYDLVFLSSPFTEYI